MRLNLCRDEEALRQKEKDKEAEKDRERGRDRDRERERPKVQLHFLADSCLLECLLYRNGALRSAA